MEESVKKTEAAIEAILFSMGDAVELKDLADVLQIDGKTVQKILDDMMVRYEEEDRVYVGSRSTGNVKWLDGRYKW